MRMSLTEGQLWEPVVDPAEWPEMREYISPSELDAYMDLYNAAVEAEAAKESGERKVIDLDEPPSAPVRLTLTLEDLKAAEEERARESTVSPKGAQCSQPNRTSSHRAEPASLRIKLRYTELSLNVDWRDFSHS